MEIIEITLVNPQIGEDCTVCSSHLNEQNNCSFCGHAVCPNCIVKIRLYQGNNHQVCASCERNFIHNLIVEQYQKEINEKQCELENIQQQFKSSRQQVFEIRNNVENENQQKLINMIQSKIDDKDKQINILLEKQNITRQQIEEADQQIQMNRDRLLAQDIQSEENKKKLQQLQEKQDQQQIQFEEIQGEIDKIIQQKYADDGDTKNQNGRETYMDNSSYDAIFRPSDIQPLGDPAPKPKKDNDCVIQ